jgi:Protein of unknown function (DUF2637)
MSAVAEARSRSIRTARMTARVLVVGAFALSSVALCELAMAARIPAWLAWIWPVCVDGLIFQAAQAVSALAGRKDSDALSARRWFQWMIGGGVTVSVLANGLHAWMMIGHELTWWQVTLVAIVPPILLLVATHGVTILAGVEVVDGIGEGLGELGDAEQAGVAQPRAIEQQPAPQLSAPEPQAALEPVTARQRSRRPAATQRDPARVVQAKELAAAGEPVEVIAKQLEVSTRTVRRYLRVEVTETVEQRPQLFAVENRDPGLEVVSG